VTWANVHTRGWLHSHTRHCCRWEWNPRPLDAVELHLRHKRPIVCFTVCLLVRLSVVSVGGVRPMGGRNAMLYRNLRGGGDKNPGSTNKYTKSGQLFIGKIIATRCHILRLKCTKLDSWCLSVCLFVRLSICVSDGVWHLTIPTLGYGASPPSVMGWNSEISWYSVDRYLFIANFSGIAFSAAGPRVWSNLLTCLEPLDLSCSRFSFVPFVHFCCTTLTVTSAMQSNYARRPRGTIKTFTEDVSLCATVHCESSFPTVLLKGL